MRAQQRLLGTAGTLLSRALAEQSVQGSELERLRGAAADHAGASAETARFRDQMLGIVGHDLRNPLGAVVMSAALLQKRGALSGWQARTVDRIRSSAGRMRRIIDDLLSYTRTRLGTGIPMTRRPADLDVLCRRVIDELLAANPDRTVDYSAEGPLDGEWDPDRLEQVLSNLVGNALEHGEPDVPVRVRAEGAAAEVRVEVRNAAHLLPPDFVEHAFEPFRRGPDATSRKATGLGLGLFIAREIVRAHGGEVAIHSSDGEGLALSIVLPRRPADQPEALPPA